MRTEPPLKTKAKLPFDFLAKVGEGMALDDYRKNQKVYSQGDPADAIFYIQNGKVKLTVISQQGKEAVVGILGTGDFFGEGCLAGQPLRMSTVTAMSQCAIVRLKKQSTIRVLHEEPAFAELFLTYVLSRNMRLEEDLVDQLFNSSEKRLARVLLLLANFGKEGKPEQVIPNARVSFFMNKFRKLGLIDYNGGLQGLQVHSSLVNIILHD